MRKHESKVFLPVLLLITMMACSNESPTPLPLGYFRIDVPEAVYVQKSFDCPFVFEISELSRLEFYSNGSAGERCWFDLYYPGYKARVHFTYKTLDQNLREYIEESRNMAYEHQIKASKIKSTVVRKPDENVYGLSFELDGNVASPFQFYLTDSTTHFLRGSLYFESKPNQDSLKPVLEHVKKDFVHFFRTFHWD